ncbi:hypothetical protein A2U01_0107530 [Trifolium medium]|nr:hypothetical protein [Trifolium medium]
MRLRDGL